MGKSRKEESRKKSKQKDRAKSGRERKKKAHTNKFKVKRNEITTKTKSPFGMTIGSDFAKLNCIVKIFNMFV